MKIILDAWFDNNFGDDLFINTVLNRYPEDEFYVFWERVHPAVLDQAKAYSRLKILPGNCSMMENMAFDGYIQVGGDVYMNWGDYSRRIRTMRAVKKAGGFVALLGFSLYETYCEETKADLRTMMGLADVIVVRDSTSAQRLKTIAPDVSIINSSDMAFAGEYCKPEKTDREVLGIAPRRKYMAKDEDHSAYCEAMAVIADGWLANHPQGTARFLALSTGDFDDIAVSREIMGMMQHGQRAEVVGYDGDMDAFVAAMGGCSAMLPTRFHALVFALMFGIPFVPVTYEVKLNQLLDELGDTALRLPYGQKISDSAIAEAVAQLDAARTDSAALEAYSQKSRLFFEKTDALIAKARANEDSAEEPRAFVCHRMTQLKELQAKYDTVAHEAEMLAKDKEIITNYYYDLLAKSNSFKGLAYLFAKKIFNMLKRGKA